MHHPPRQDRKHMMLLNDPKIRNSEKNANSSSSAIQIADERLIVQIQINGHTLNATLETGASNNFISHTLANKVGIYKQQKVKTTQVKMADGTSIFINKAISSVSIQLGHETVKGAFLILPHIIDEVILGLDFLKSIRTTITLGEASITLDDSSTENLSNVSTNILDEDEMVVAQQFVDNELAKFKTITGLTNITTHRIVMKDEQPIKQKAFPINTYMLKVIDDQLEYLIAKGWIEPSNSSYSAPIVFLKTRNEKWRFVVDYRELNAHSIKEQYALPRVQNTLNRLSNAKFISTINLKDGHYQIPLDEDSKKYTAFEVPNRGLFHWRIMPYGLKSAPVTFQRALNQVIGADLEPHAFAYLDDIIVTGSSFKHHMVILKEILCRIKSANLKINLEKCSFFKTKTKYLGHIVSLEGTYIDPDKVAAIRDIQPPNNIGQLRQFIEISYWYRRFVFNFDHIMEPLINMLTKDTFWNWGEIQQKAFDRIKIELTEAPTLTCPDFNRKFCLQTDVSEGKIWAVVTQKMEGRERVIEYASRYLTPAEIEYPHIQKECLAIAYGIKSFRPYLEGYRFTIVTDEVALKLLTLSRKPTEVIAKLAIDLHKHQFDVRHRQDKLNMVSDTLPKQLLQMPKKSKFAAEGATCKCHLKKTLLLGKRCRANI